MDKSEPTACPYRMKKSPWRSTLQTAQSRPLLPKNEGRGSGAPSGFRTDANRAYGHGSKQVYVNAVSASYFTSLQTYKLSLSSTLKNAVC